MMMPKPTRLTKIVRKMMRSGRVTSPNILYNQPVHIVLSRLLLILSIVMATLSGQTRTAQIAPTPEPTRLAGRGETMRPQIRGTHGIVAAGRHYSVSAGIRILEQGGNAIDAGVA